MNRYDFILETVRTAGAELMRLRDGHFGITVKDGDPKNIVTDVDMRVNELLVSAIKEKFPGESVYSEETETSFAQTGVQWVIDPIDGTSNFSRGIPHFAVVLGVIEDGIPTAGAVFNPVTNELFSFKKGEGAFLNGKAIRVLPQTELKRAMILFRAGRKRELAEWGGQSYAKLLQNSWKTGGFGSAALDTCFVAAGRVEASTYGTFSALDVAPALGILFEAGGIAVTKDGSPVGFSPESETVITANSKEIADSLRALLFT